MNGRTAGWVGALCVALSWMNAGIAEESAAQVERPASESASDAAKSPKKPTAVEACAQECNIADGKCNSEVRQARAQCSRSAANSGRDPMSMRNNNYTYFCSYFRNPDRRGPGNVDVRFKQHYNLCVDVMEQNIASMRYDCYRNEVDTQNICRTELRECQAACQ